MEKTFNGFLRRLRIMNFYSRFNKKLVLLLINNNSIFHDYLLLVYSQTIKQIAVAASPIITTWTSHAQYFAWFSMLFENGKLPNDRRDNN